VTAPLAAQRPPLPGLWLRVQRERALIALFDLGRQKSYGLRAAKLYAIGVFVSYAIAISLTRGSERASTIHGFVRAALVSLSWVVGALAALGSAQALAQQSEREALSALALQRGFSEKALLRARTLYIATVLLTLIFSVLYLYTDIALWTGRDFGLATVWASTYASTRRRIMR